MFGFSNSFSIDQEEFQKKAAQGAHIIDVRSPQEFNEGHIKNSVNIPMNMLGVHLNDLKKYAEKKEVVLLYCLTGSRSAFAYRFLNKNGLAEQMYDLKGGTARWSGSLG